MERISTNITKNPLKFLFEAQSHFHLGDQAAHLFEDACMVFHTNSLFEAHFYKL